MCVNDLRGTVFNHTRRMELTVFLVLMLCTCLAEVTSEQDPSAGCGVLPALHVLLLHRAHRGGNTTGDTDSIQASHVTVNISDGV